MQELLQLIDVDYYRSAQLLIAHAEIAQLRRQSSVLTCGNQPRTPTAARGPLDDSDQTVTPDLDR